MPKSSASGGSGSCGSGSTIKPIHHPSPNTKSIRGPFDIQLSKSLSWVLRHAAPSVGLQLSPDGFVPLAEILALHHPRFRTKDGKPKYAMEDVIRVVENNDKQRFRLEFRDVIGRKYGTMTTSGYDRLQYGNGHAECDDNDDSKPGSHEYDKRVLYIRANQGHSLKGLQADQLLSPLTSEQLSNPSLFIIHGTTQKAWEEHIKYEGLSRMKRNHIHFATGLPTSQPKSTTFGDTKRRDESNYIPPISGMRSSSEICIYINGAKCAHDGIPFYRSDNGVILTAGVTDEGVLPTKYFEKVVHASSGTILWNKEES